MEITKYIKYKDEKIPYVNTPLNREDIWFLKDNYERFIINDVHRGTAKFYKGDEINKNYVVDFNFKHVFYFVSSLYGIYKVFKTKKEFKKTVNKYNPIDIDKNFTEKLNDWAIKESITKEKSKEFTEAPAES